MWVAAVVTTGAGVWYVWTQTAGRELYFDEQGVAHGSGVTETRYRSGALMAEERYERGRLARSTWYRPDGSLVARTDWKNGTGLGYYLREDGSVRARMQYVDGVAHGQAVYYTPEGHVERFAEFRDGTEVTASTTAATAPAPGAE